MTTKEGVWKGGRGLVSLKDHRIERGQALSIRKEVEMMRHKMEAHEFLQNRMRAWRNAN